MLKLGYIRMQALTLATASNLFLSRWKMQSSIATGGIKKIQVKNRMKQDLKLQIHSDCMI